MATIDELVAGLQVPDEERKRLAWGNMLLGLGGGLMGARRGQEWQGAGMGLLGGANMAQNAIADARQQRFDKLRATGAAYDLAAKEAQFNDAELMRQQQKDFAQRFGGGLPPTAGSPSTPQNYPDANRSLGSNPVTLPANSPAALAGRNQQANPVPGKRDVAAKYQAYGDYWMAQGRSEKAQQYYDFAQKMLPQIKDQKILTQNGQRVVVNVYNDGSHEVLPDVGPDLEKAHFGSTGGTTNIPLDPFTGSPMGPGMPATMTPAEIASDQVSRGNLAVNQGQLRVAQAREGREARNADAGQWTNDLERGIQINARTGESRPIMSGGQAIGSKSDIKRQQAASNVIDILDMAEPLIKQSTGSYIGNVTDMTAQAFGKATKGSVAAGQLEALEGALMMAQPRMEGPQSDKDTALYRKMAGEIGNPNVPAGRKLAAVQMIRKLYSKYAGLASQQRAGLGSPSVGDLETEMKRRGIQP